MNNDFLYVDVMLLEGDSGGPLMILNRTDHRWYLYGVTSHGSNSDTIQPGVYSSVSSKLDFIRTYV
jgi:secreted trypsin-like serine protease